MENEFLKKLINHANFFFFYADTRHNIVFCNKKFTDFLGCQAEEIAGRLWEDILYREPSSKGQLQMAKAIIEDCISYRRTNHLENMLGTPGGAPRIVSWDVVPVFSQSDAWEGLLFTGNDLSELTSRDSSLTKIDETLKNIFTNIKEYALFVANLDGNITYYTVGSELMFGWSKNEIVFKHVSLLFNKEEAATELSFMLDEVRKTGRFEAEVAMVKKSSESFPVNLTIDQFIDTGGEHSGYIFIAKDITEKKKMEHQIFQAEKMSAIGQLAAGMAHDINNPLFVISGKTEMLMEEEGLSLDFKNDLTTIHAQAERIRKLVERLLKFARKSAPHSEVLNINETIEGVLPLVTYHKLPSMSVEVEKRFSQELPAIKGDLNQLQEVLLNLFINAHQAMPQGGTLTIETSNFLNRFAEIKIKDTGGGISEENLKNIFVPFFSTKKEGTGLGLSICYNIVKNHGGTIEVESQSQKGTIFTIHLPFA